MKKVILICAACAALIACETPYAPKSVWSYGGYEDLALKPGYYLVSFKGNSQVDTPQKVFQKLFYRAAEISKEQGAQYFIVEQFNANQTPQTTVLPAWGTSNAGGEVFINPTTGFGSYNTQSNGVYIPSQTINYQDIIMQTVIKVVKEPSPTEKDKLVDGAFILSNWKE
jgi:hypothetical protein